MIRYLILVMLFSTASCTTMRYTKTYKGKCGAVNVILKLNEDNSQGEVRLSILDRSNSFIVENKIHSSSELFLVKVKEKYRAYLGGEVKNDSIVNFRSVLNNEVIWQCLPDRPLVLN